MKRALRRASSPGWSVRGARYRRWAWVVAGLVFSLGLPRQPAAAATLTALAPMNSQRRGHNAILAQDGKVVVLMGKDSAGPVAPVDTYNPATGAWTTGPSPSVGRSGATAVVLRNGKILVAGGQNAAGAPVANADLYDPRTQSWATAGTMVKARYGATATLLFSGKVLVAGGIGASGAYLKSAELFDPSAVSWTATGSMASARVYHAAALLPTEGTVLVSGGKSGGATYLDSLELYDPATGTFSDGGAMYVPRAYHTATTLQPDGADKVLLAGGKNQDGVPASCDVYYSWGFCVPTVPLNVARNSHTATLLPNGTVLVMGGAGAGGTVLSSAEVYAVQGHSASWTLTASMTTTRAEHTATLLPSGEVLVAGGVDNAGNVLSSAEVYRWMSGTWSNAASYTPRRAYHATTLLPDGRVLVIGGYYNDGSDHYLADAATYDWSAEWSGAGGVNQARCRHTATLLQDGKVLVVGGANGTGSYLASAEVYDPSSGLSTGTNPMGVARCDHTATLLPNGKVLVAGGRNAGALDSAEIFDPAAGTWAPAATAMSTARYAHSAVVLPSGKVLVAFGDSGGGPTGAADLFDPDTTEFTSTGGLTTSRKNAPALLLPNGKVLAVGGAGGSGPLASTEVFDPELGSWSAAGTMAYARQEHSATLLLNGLLLVAGGGGSGGGMVSTAELYDPATNAFSSTGSLDAGRKNHSAVLLPDGKVLVAFGQNGATYLDTARLYDEGRAFAASRRPTLTSVTNPARVGMRMSASGAGFQGVSEASSGVTSSSACNYPLLMLMGLEQGTLHYLPPDSAASWSAAKVKPLAPSTMLPGWYRVCAIAAGVPSVSKVTFLSKGGSVFVASVTPDYGWAAGGMTVTIQGQQFETAATVKFDSVTATGVSVVNGSTLTCATPPHPAGYSEVTVTTAAGQATLVDAFRFLSLTPREGRMGGGETVTVSGADFVSPAIVAFDAEVATNVVVVDAATLTCLTPLHVFGFADVTVATPGDSATLVDGFKFLGMEGDVAPTPTGDDDLTTTDLSQQRLFVASVQTPTPGPEYQKADVAPPEPNKGDGVIDTTDLSQMRRYVASLDPAVDAGGPSFEGSASVQPEWSARELRVAGAALQRGGAGRVAVQLNSQGNETALSFTLTFDPAVLNYRRTRLAPATAAAGFTLTVNENEAAAGRVGVVADSAQSLEAGWQEVVLVEFAAAATAQADRATLDFACRPTPLSASDAQARALGLAPTPGLVLLNNSTEQSR